MVTVDDATYVKMRDTLYWGDAWKASKAKAQIESSYDDAKYNSFLWQLNSMQTPATSNSNSWPADGYATATERNMATWGSEFWRTNQTSNQTPNTPATPVTQTEDVVKTEVVETPEIKQEWALKPLSQDYYDQTSQEAQDKIIANLNNYKQTNPEYFRDYESFKKNFSYDSRSEEQKNTLDTWYGGYQQGLQLSSLPVTDLYTQYKDWSISSNDLESLRISNPTKYAELQDTINRGNIIAAYDDDKGETWFANNIQEMAYNMLQQSFMQFMGGDSSSWASDIFRGYEEKMESPEMLALSDQTTEVQEQIENITSDLDSIKKSVEKEYEGTWASRAKINAIIADRSYDLQLQLRTLNSEYNKYATQYNNRMQQYQNEFNMQLQEYQINRQERQQQMQELGFAMDLMSFETPQQKEEREWNYWVKQQEYANGNINSKDYNTRYKAALNSVQNLLSQYEGIPMVRSAEEMADDILKAIDGGSSLGKELSKINQQIQKKPEYKQLYNATYGTWSTNSWFGKTIKIGDMEFVEYNGGRYTADQIKEMFKGGQTGSAKPYELVDESVFSANISPMGVDADGNIDKIGNNLGKFLMQKANGMKGGQCGKYVNDYLEFIGMTWSTNRYYDNELSTKLNSINSYDPKVGTVAVFDYNHKSSDGVNYWHVGIVTQVTNDGIYVKDSNYSGDEKIKTRFIPKGSAEWENNLKGFFDPSRPPLGTTTTGKQEENNFVSWSIQGVPLAYERAVKNLVPAALQNSDAEREALNTVITNAFKGGIDQSQIALTFMGFNIKNEADRDLALDLVNVTRTLNDDNKAEIVQSISDLINQGKYSNAIQTVENAVTQQAKQAGNYVSEASVKNTINKANSLSEYMDGLNKSPVGVVEGTMQEWLKRLSSKQAKEISNRIAQIETTLDIKDEETLRRIVPQLSDQPSVFMSKLQNLGDNAMVELNGRRTIYGLPALDQDSVINYSNRVNLYKNWGSEIATATVNRNSWVNVRNAITALNEQFGLR